jgi:hypothetical protein
MNDDIQKFTMVLFRRLSRIYLLLEQCRQLYPNKETVSLLNETAGLFFNIVQEQFMDAILLSISNIIDKEDTFGHRNLTIRALPQMTADEELRSEVEKLCDFAKDKSSFIKDHRNKRIAHFDELFHLDIDSMELELATFKKIEISLDAIYSVLNLVSNKCFNNHLEMKFINLRGGADELVAQLMNRAQQADEAKK